MNHLRTFGRRFDPEGLRLAREAAGMSVKELSTKVYEDERRGAYRFQNLEDGKVEPFPRTVIAICRILKCSMDDIAPRL